MPPWKREHIDAVHVLLDFPKAFDKVLHMRALRLSSVIVAYEEIPSSGSNASSLNAPNKLSWRGKPQQILQSHLEYLEALPLF